MAATTSRWTFAHTLSVGLCLALLVRTGLGQGLDFLPRGALRHQKILGSEGCLGAMTTLIDCVAELSPAIPGKRFPPPGRREGMLETHELFFTPARGAGLVLKEVLRVLFKITSVPVACCRSVNEISEKCWALDLILQNHLGFQLVSAFCKPFDD